MIHHIFSSMASGHMHVIICAHNLNRLAQGFLFAVEIITIEKNSKIVILGFEIRWIRFYRFCSSLLWSWSNLNTSLFAVHYMHKNNENGTNSIFFNAQNITSFRFYRLEITYWNLYFILGGKQYTIRFVFDGYTIHVSILTDNRKFHIYQTI